MESIAELRTICQSTAKKDVSNVYMRYVSRFLSIYLTRALLPTPVTPNQVSFVMILAGILSGLIFLLPWKQSFLVGAFVLQFWYILDCVDGEVARYRHYKTTGSVAIDKRQASLAGAYYDMINHYIVNFLVPITIALGLTLQTANIGWTLLGVAGALGQVLMLALHDAKCRVFIYHLKKYAFIEPVEEAASNVAKQRSPLHTAFSALHYSMTYPTVMNLVGLAAIFNFVFPVWEWRKPLLLFLSVGSAIVTTALITWNISNRRMDAEFKQAFKLSEAKPAESLA